MKNSETSINMYIPSQFYSEPKDATKERDINKSAIAQFGYNSQDYREQSGREKTILKMDTRRRLENRRRNLERTR